MSANYPADRFDQVRTVSGSKPGVHRLGPRPYPALRQAGWYALAVVVLSGLGIGWLVRIDAGLFSGNADILSLIAPTPEVTPLIDPTIPVSVFNGTPTDTLTAEAAASLKAAGLTVGLTTNADNRAITTSVVFYVSPGRLAAAKGVAKLLGISAVQQSDTYQSLSEITVVLGSNFVPQPLG